jgi:hypothetical protein
MRRVGAHAPDRGCRVTPPLCRVTEAAGSRPFRASHCKPTAGNRICRARGPVYNALYCRELSRWAEGTGLLPAGMPGPACAARSVDSEKFVDVPAGADFAEGV